MASKPIKTNAMRILDRAKISYEAYEYEVDENDLSGTHIADSVGLPYEIVFKTIIAKGDKSGYVVLCIPVDKEIDLKKAAISTNNKRVELIAVKDLLPLTGYVRGGCSPIGLKKPFPVFIDKSAENHEKITISAGIRGCQLLVSQKELVEFTKATLCDLCN